MSRRSIYLAVKLRPMVRSGDTWSSRLGFSRGRRRRNLRQISARALAVTRPTTPSDTSTAALSAKAFATLGVPSDGGDAPNASLPVSAENSSSQSIHIRNRRRER